MTDDEHYFLLNSGVESTHPPTEKTIFPNAFEVDYVRVYDRPDGPTLLNGGFESEDFQPWKVTGHVARVADKTRRGSSGAFALRVSDGGAADQKLYGLKPNTTYDLTGWVKTLTGEGRLIVDGWAGVPSKNDWSQRVTFTTGAESSIAIVRCAVSGADGAAVFDDIKIRARPDPATRDN